MNIDELELVTFDSAHLWRIEPGDVLVLTVPSAISDHQAERLKKFIEDKFENFGVKCLVLGDGLELKVLRRA